MNICVVPKDKISIGNYDDLKQDLNEVLMFNSNTESSTNILKDITRPHNYHTNEFRKRKLFL